MGFFGHESCLKRESRKPSALKRWIPERTISPRFLKIILPNSVKTAVSYKQNHYTIFRLFWNPKFYYYAFFGIGETVGPIYVNRTSNVVLRSFVINHYFGFEIIGLLFYKSIEYIFVWSQPSMKGIFMFWVLINISNCWRHFFNCKREEHPFYIITPYFSIRKP